MRTPVIIGLATTSPKLEVSAVDGPEDALVEAVDVTNGFKRERLRELPR